MKNKQEWLRQEVESLGLKNIIVKTTRYGFSLYTNGDIEKQADYWIKHNDFEFCDFIINIPQLKKLIEIAEKYKEMK